MEQARTLRAAHASYAGTVEATRPPPEVRPLIVDSWRRSREAGVSPEGHIPPRLHSRDDVRDLRQEHPLARMMPTLRSLLLDVAEAAQHIVAVCAADGEMLWVEGPARVCDAVADSMNFAEGALWSEAGAGTNALGTALATGHPMQVFAAEHFNATAHPWTCSAAPIFDPESGRLLGAVDLTGPYRMTHPHSLALVTAAAGAATGALRRERRQHDERLRDRYIRRLVHLGQRPTGVVSRSGRVVMAHPTGWLGTHVAIPHEGHVGFLPGGETFRAEPIGVEGGYLVWAAPRSGEAPPRRELRLRLMGEPRAWLDGSPLHLSPRHAEILALLALRPEGLTSEQLGAALYGPGYPVASVRSEVSRLRRLIGSALATRPYRLVADVDADVLDVCRYALEGSAADVIALAGDGLLPRSCAPGVEELRTEIDDMVRDAEARLANGLQPPCNV